MDRLRLQLLVVAADPAVYAELVEHLQTMSVGADVHRVAEAGPALAFVRGEAPYDAGLLPDLVLLDLDLPDAQEILDALEADPELDRRLALVPLAVDTEAALARLGDRSVHEILHKPLEADALRRMLSYIDEL